MPVTETVTATQTPAARALPDSLTAQLKQVLGPKGWSQDAHELAPHIADWRGRYQGATPILLKPANTEEVAACVRLCHEAGVAITPQGGNTSLCGAATPMGEVLLTLKRMTGVREVDVDNDSMTVEAGCVLENLQTLAADHNRLFPLSLGSQGSAMIGGLISTNAGGVHVLRYGMTRELVLGLEAVLPDGTIWSGLTGLRKDNTGYDLKQLLIGAEGTLGIITAATLKLFPRPARMEVAFCGLASAEDAVKFLGLAKQVSGGAVTAFELMPRMALDMVLEHVPGTRDPLEGEHAWYVVCEMSFGRANGARETLEDALGQGFEAGLIADAAIAENDSQIHDFWRLRETIAEAERAHGKAVKHDVSIPVSKMPAFMAQATTAVEAAFPGALVIAFGHVGDGNVHFNVAARETGADDDFIAQAAPLSRLVYDLVDSFGGSISAEHGIGILKRAELAARKPVDVAVMRAIKTALDPKGIMNPRVLL
ncbi:4-phosphoerythronate dehydrogenase (FAD-dependent) [Maricaulis maris MCS10]|uniref:4-phosphoerythronate dehydrogenase (FAD-dependent) n=1 Tax=Maricaulis maris (strain MCS10) TaxID=394221 RepID=Q0ARG4_MARMM|nr:FAD-binding oxidoreductase [Maricaulis maris]ABI65123.1 4-phosphoerythronate dehydrogenase (FAD-dependent) [Maricaulis maris MCS10]